MKTILHVNHHEGEGRLEGALRMAHALGYDGMELRRNYRFKDFTAAQYRARLEAEKQAHPDFEFVFGGLVDCHAADEDAVRRAVESYQEFLAWAARACGTRQVNLMTGTLVRPGATFFEFERNGSNLATDFHYERSARWLRVIGDTAQSLNLRVALETHNCYLHDLAQPCVRLMEMTAHSAIGINFDYGNIILNPNGEPFEEAFNLLAPHIRHVHLKNVQMPAQERRHWFGTHLDQGCIDNARLLERLRDLRYDGMLCVEFPSTGDGLYAAKRAKDYLAFLCAYLGIA